MDATAGSTPSQLNEALQRLLQAQVDRNGLWWGVLRFAVVGTMTVYATYVAYSTQETHLQKHLPTFWIETLITAVGCVAVFASPWLRHHQFVTVVVLDIPFITLERWYYLPNSFHEEGAALLGVFWLILLVVLSQFSLNRRLVVAATLVAMVSAAIITIHGEALPVFLGMSLIVLALVGAGSWLLVGHALRLMNTLAERGEGLRRLLAHVETARDDERSRLSHNLHDELGQELSALSFALAYTVRRANSEPQSLETNLGELGRLLGHTQQTVRGIVTDLRPRVIDELGFRAGLEWLVQRARQRGLQCELILEGDHTVDERLGVATYRVLQEALTNVVRHAQAKRATVTLATSPEGLKLVVADDGVGIAPTSVEEAQKRGGGMGLVGMRERAEEFGGELTVSSGAPSGTEVRLHVPTAKA